MNYNKKDFRHFRFLAKYVSLFGILPLIQGRNFKLPKRRWALCYVLIQLSFICVLSIPLALIKIAIFFSRLHYIVSITGELIWGCLIVTSLVKSYTKRYLWVELYRKFQVLESFEFLNTQGSREKYSIRTMPYGLVYHVITFLWICLGYVLYSDSLNLIYFFAFTLRLYFVFFLCTTTTSLVSTMAVKYDNVKNFLIVSMRHSGFHSKKIIKKSQHMYIAMTEIVDIFNKLIGHQLLLLMAYQLIEFLAHCNLIFMLKDLLRKKPSTLLTTLWTVLPMVILPLHALNSFEAAKRKERGMIPVCYTIQKRFENAKDEQYHDLQNLAKLVHSRIPRIVAADFFELNSSEMFSLINVGAMYFILIAQMYNIKC